MYIIYYIILSGSLFSYLFTSHFILWIFRSTLLSCVSRFVHLVSKCFCQDFQHRPVYKFPVVLTAFNLFCFCSHCVTTYGCIVEAKAKKVHTRLNWCIYVNKRDDKHTRVKENTPRAGTGHASRIEPWKGFMSYLCVVSCSSIIIIIVVVVPTTRMKTTAAAAAAGAQKTHHDVKTTRETRKQQSM